MKVTPAHDFNDFATGKRHGLEEINILEPRRHDERRTPAPFAGHGPQARRARAVKKALDEKGLARGSQAAHAHAAALPALGRRRRADDLDAVVPEDAGRWPSRRSRPCTRARREIIPAEWTKTYDHFLENIQDWCISRQLWWGHQIPAWHDARTGEIRVARERARRTSSAEWAQDPDVLDTWFSSALWPFSTLGWPDETPALAKFYPASDLETGYDILFFWVARMMMIGPPLHGGGAVPARPALTGSSSTRPATR